MQRLSLILIAAVFLGAGIVQAHPNHDDMPLGPGKALATPAKTRHAVEGVIKDGTARVSISRDGSKVSTANAFGVLIVDAKPSRAEYILQPAGDNAMVTREKVKLTPGTRATVAVSLGDRAKVEEEITLR